jgi:hypothetical protein
MAMMVCYAEIDREAESIETLVMTSALGLRHHRVTERTPALDLDEVPWFLYILVGHS